MVALVDPGFDFWHLSIGVSQNCHRMECWFIGPLFHLKLARAAFGRAELGLSLLHGANQWPADT